MTERGRTQFCTGCVAGLPRTDDGYHVEQLDPTVRAYRRCRAVWGSEDLVGHEEPTETEDL